MRVAVGTETSEVPRFMGSKGIIELTEFGLSYTPQAGIDLAPSYYCYGLPSRLKNAYFKQWHDEHDPKPGDEPRSEEHTSELQSHLNLVCRLLLEKKKLQRMLCYKVFVDFM